MYIPAQFKLEDPEAIAGLIGRYNFALLVTAPEGRPTATHLPFLFDPEPGGGRLLAHMARANPQWRDFAALARDGGEALVVFSGPHTYVSPSWYGGGPAVPTWNYLAVHAYGLPRVLEQGPEVRGLIERLVAYQEAAFERPWRMESQEEGYLSGMLRGIVAFEIPIARLEAKAKLSQNKSAADRDGVIAALEASGTAEDAAVAASMRRLLPVPEPI